MNYAIYARKSQESEERQVQSIEDQLRLGAKLAADQGLQVLPEHVISEAKSAKEPHAREAFARLVKLVERGKVQGIIAYHPNRLSRNETDAAVIIRLLRERRLRDLRFVSYHFENSPEGVMFLQLSLSQSQYESAKLSREVLRGIDSKIAKGWWPGKAPEGYLNDLENRTIVPDPERLALIRRAFGLILAGTHTVSQAARVLNEDWGYRTRRRRRTGGGPLSRTAAYRMFTNVFYAGYMRIRGEVVRGAHPAILTLEEFERAQELVRTRGSYREHRFTYNRLVRCGDCGRAVAGELQKGRHKRGAWIYYRCGNPRCAGPRRSIREDRLEAQLDEALRGIACEPELKRALLGGLAAWMHREFGDLAQLQATQKAASDEAERKRNALLELRLNGEVDPETFRRKDEELRLRADRLRVQAEDSETRRRQVSGVIERATEFRAHAHRTFRVGTPEQRREIASALATECRLRDGQLQVFLHPLLRSLAASPEPRPPSGSGSGTAKTPTLAKSVPTGAASGGFPEPFRLAWQGMEFPEVNLIPPDPLT